MKLDRFDERSPRLSCMTVCDAVRDSSYPLLHPQPRFVRDNLRSLAVAPLVHEMLVAHLRSRCRAVTSRGVRWTSQATPDRVAATAPTAFGRVSTATFKSAFVLSRAVKEALRNRQPVVALEVRARSVAHHRASTHSPHPPCCAQSTIISHGMPYPDNVATALQVEGIVAAGGAVPATIALLDGRIHVGLESEALERLGERKDDRIVPKQPTAEPTCAPRQVHSTSHCQWFFLCRQGRPGGGPQVQHTRDSVASRKRWTGRHHGGRHHDDSSVGGRAYVRDGRHWWCAPRRGGHVGHLCGPHRAQSHPSGGGVCGREEHPGYSQNAGVRGDHGSAGDDAGPGKLSRLLLR